MTEPLETPSELDELLTSKYINFNHGEISLHIRVSKPMVLLPVAEAKAAIERLIAEARIEEVRKFDQPGFNTGTYTDDRIAQLSNTKGKEDK